jgi:hypothetical protein
MYIYGLYRRTRHYSAAISIHFSFLVFQKPHRLLPTNLYVVLYNFKSRHPDELDLK